PVRSGWKFIRAHIEDGRVVQGPLHSIPGTRHYAQHRRFPRLGDGRLPTGERQAAGLVRRHHGPFKDREGGLIGLNTDQKLGAPDPATVKGVRTSRLRGPRLKKWAAPLSSATTPVRSSFTASRVSVVFALSRSTDWFSMATSARLLSCTRSVSPGQ